MAEKPRRGIPSFEVGTQLLVELVRHVKPMALKDLSKATGMSTGKAHPYLASFLKVGFVTQDSSGSYELGPLALQLGLARLQRLDAVKEASPFIEELAAQTAQSIAVAVWGNLGPTVVRLEEPIHPLHVNLRTGTVMSLAYTATGRLFAAYMPPKVVERLVAEDIARQGGRSDGTALLTRMQLDEALTETRRNGLSRTIGQPIPGINAFCAPVFDAEAHLVLGSTAMGPAATFRSTTTGTERSRDRFARARSRCRVDLGISRRHRCWARSAKDIRSCDHLDPPRARTENQATTAPCRRTYSDRDAS